MIITLKNGTKEFENALTLTEIAKSISEGLAREAVVAKVDGELTDMTTVIDKDAEVTFYTLKDEEGLDVYRHTCAHVLAQAVKTIYPTCKLAIGPTIENALIFPVEGRCGPRQSSTNAPCLYKVIFASFGRSSISITL